MSYLLALPCRHIFSIWDGGSQNRLASIFWEPGQYQIILNFTLILCSNDIIDLFKEHRYMILIKKYIILIVALMLTKSTAGYIAFGIICIYVMFNVLDKQKIGQADYSNCFLCYLCVSFVKFRCSTGKVCSKE